MSSGCGCKEVYTFPQTTYPYSSCICSFWQQHPYIFVHFLNVFVIYICWAQSMDLCNPWIALRKPWIRTLCDNPWIA